MEVKMYKSKLVFLLIAIFIFSVRAKCSDTIIDNYQAWENVLSVLIEEDKAREISETKKNEILLFSKKINQIIINKDINSLLKYMSGDDFRFYYTKGNKSENYIEIIKNDFLNREGFYNFLFDKKKYYSEASIKPSELLYRRKIYDVSRYLTEYKDKLTWRIFYLPKYDAYDAWFSIPNDLIAEFEYFHYRIKKIDGKLVLIGF